MNECQTTHTDVVFIGCGGWGMGMGDTFCLFHLQLKFPPINSGFSSRTGQWQEPGFKESRAGFLHHHQHHHHQQQALQGLNCCHFQRIVKPLKRRRKNTKEKKKPHRRAIKVKHVYKTEPPPLLPIADSRTHSVAWPDAALSATAIPFPIRAVGQSSGDSPPEWGHT